MIPVIDKPRIPIIPYGPGTPYATVNDLPENCTFLAPNGGVYLKQGETVSIITDAFDGVVLSDDAGNLLTADNLSVILEN